MSRISENIRKIIRAWGGKPTGNGISDALSDLYNNLPFGTKVETVEILEEQTVTLEADPTGELIGGIEAECVINTNNEYIIKWNGKDYKCKPFDLTESYGAETYMFIDSNDIELAPTKFALAVVVPAKMISVYSYDGSTSVTLSITTEQETVTPIPQKYLPEGIGGGNNIIIKIAEDGTGSCDKTFGECITLLSTTGASFLLVDNVNHQVIMPMNIFWSDESILIVCGFFAEGVVNQVALSYKADGTITMM